RGAASAAAGLWLGREMTTPRAGVGVPRSEAPISRLPANARNVAYYLLPPVAYYEFDTDEAGFEEWGGRWRLAREERGEGPRTAVIWAHAAGRRGEVQIPDRVACGWWEGTPPGPSPTTGATAGRTARGITDSPRLPPTSFTGIRLRWPVQTWRFTERSKLVQ